MRLNNHDETFALPSVFISIHFYLTKKKGRSHNGFLTKLRKCKRIEKELIKYLQTNLHEQSVGGPLCFRAFVQEEGLISGGPLYRRVFVQKGGLCAGGGSLCRRAFVQGDLCTGGLLCKRAFVQEGLYAGGPLFRRAFVQECLCTGGPLCRRAFVQEGLCAGGPLCRRSFVQEGLCTGRPLCRRRAFVQEDIWDRRSLSRKTCRQQGRLLAAGPESLWTIRLRRIKFDNYN